MKNHASKHEFEEAGRTKQKIERLSQIHDRQVVRDAVSGDHDVIVMIEKYKKTYIGRLEVRSGQIV